ncbi:MAG: hypothetical protein ABFS19_13940 [Thermodesulfobacteriota bacterium]
MIRLVLLLLLLFPANIFAAAPTPAARQYVTLNLPQQVLTSCVKKALPIKIDHGSSNLEGDILITSVNNFRVENKRLAADLILTGNDLHLVTAIGSRNIRLRVGSMQFHFKATANLRFDPRNRTLYIRPLVNNVQSSNQGQSEVANLLLPLINNREFPVTMKKLQPLIADTGAKKIAVSMELHDIRAQNGQLVFAIAPRISDSSKKQTRQ